MRGYFDGACRTNPGEIGLGMCMMDENGIEVESGASYRPYGTNNDAEYLALIFLLTKAKKRNVKTLHCFGDSKLVINQVNGIFKASEKFIKYIKVVKELMNHFDEIDFTWIKRAQNKRADELSKIGLNSKGKRKNSEKSSTTLLEVEPTSKRCISKKTILTPYSVSSIDGNTLLICKGNRIAVVALNSMSCSCADFLSSRECVHISVIENLLPDFAKQLTV